MGELLLVAILFLGAFALMYGVHERWGDMREAKANPDPEFGRIRSIAYGTGWKARFYERGLELAEGDQVSRVPWSAVKSVRETGTTTIVQGNPENYREYEVFFAENDRYGILKLRGDWLNLTPDSEEVRSAFEACGVAVEDAVIR